MDENDCLAMLRDISFLRGIDDEYLEPLAEVARVVELDTDEVVFREGDPALHLYLVVSGNVGLELCAPGVGCRRILTATGGDLLGWSPVLEQARLTATARTLSPSKLVEINGGQVLTQCEHNPRFGYVFMRRVALAMAKRLSATRMQLLDVFGAQMPETPLISEP